MLRACCRSHQSRVSSMYYGAYTRSIVSSASKKTRINNIHLRNNINASSYAWNTNKHSALIYAVGCSWYSTIVSLSYPTTRCEVYQTNNNEYTEKESFIENYELKQKQWGELKERIRRGYRMFLRAVKLMITLAPVIALYPFALLLSDNKKNDNDNDNVQDILLSTNDDKELHYFIRWYLQKCLKCVEASGAAVIKLMQWAGSRPDLFGHDFCSIFSQLQDNTTPHHFKHTEKMLRKAYGDNWQDQIQLKQILGSGCIGQVYKGIVKDYDGYEQEVAIKVMHPNVEDDIDADLDLMRLAVRAVQYLEPFGLDIFANFKWLNPEGIVEEFAHLLKLQLDLRKEANNIQQFNENFQDVENVIFPELIDGYEPTKDVLIESYCEGIPVLQYARENQNEKELLSKLCITGIQSVCKMIFLDNFLHGDLHPGNVYISKDGEKIILLDVGIVNEYTEIDHKSIVDILAAFIRMQGRRAGQLMIDQSNNNNRKKDNEAVIDEESFINYVDQLVTQACTQDYLMEQLAVYITRMCNAAARHHVMMNPCFVSAALGIKVQEGIALALDPSIEIWRVAGPIIFESERRRGAVKHRFVEMFPGVQNIIENLTAVGASTAAMATSPK